MLGTRKKGLTGKALPTQQEPVTITLKNLEGNKNKNKDDNTLADSNLLLEELNKIALSLFEKEEIRPEFEVLAKYATKEANDKFFIELMTNQQEVASALSTITDVAFRDNLALYIDTLFVEIEKRVASFLILRPPNSETTSSTSSQTSNTF